MMLINIARWGTLLGYFGLFFLIVAWNTWIAPVEHSPRIIILLPLTIPLLFPLRGLLHGNPYTHAWTTLIALFYFSLGVSNTVVPEDQLYGWLQILTSMTLFTGCVMFVRYSRAASQRKNHQG